MQQRREKFAAANSKMAGVPREELLLAVMGFVILYSQEGPEEKEEREEKNAAQVRGKPQMLHHHGLHLCLGHRGVVVMETSESTDEEVMNKAKTMMTPKTRQPNKKKTWLLPGLQLW